MKPRGLLLLALLMGGALLALLVWGGAMPILALSPLRGLQPAADPPSLSSVTPVEMYNYQPVALTITGAGFLTPTVSLNTVSLTKVTVIDGTMLTATVPADLPGGVYTVTVKNADGQSASLPSAFTVHHAGDGSLGTWRYTAALTTARSDHVVVTANRCIFAMGGRDMYSNLTDSIEYTCVGDRSTLSSWQVDDATLVPPGDNFAAAVYQIDESTSFVYRAGHGSKPYVLDVTGFLVDDAGQSDGWVTVGVLPALRSSPGAFVANGHLYIVGGNTDGLRERTVIYAEIQPDFTLGPWQTGPSLVRYRTSIEVIVVGDYAYVLGGSENTVERAKVNPDGSLSPWKLLPGEMKENRKWFAVAYGRGFLYAVGNGLDRSTVERAPVYADGTLGQWEYTTEMLIPRGGLGASIINGQLYAIAGSKRGDLYPIDRVASVEQAALCAPAIERIEPSAVPASRPTEIQIIGRNFLPTPDLGIPGVAILDASFVSLNVLTTTVPAGLASGWYTVALRNPDGQTAILTNALRVDDTEPVAGNLIINGGALSSTSREVALTVSASGPGGDPPAEMRFSNDGQAWSDWRTYATKTDWTLAAGDATKTVYGQFQDEAGNNSGVISDTIDLDTTAGTEYGLTINNGALFTNKAAVMLTIGAEPGTTQMQVSNDGGFAGARWEPYASRRSWEITRYGSYVIPRVVYVRYKDGAGNTSATYQDDIILDVTAPTGSVDAVAMASSGDSGLADAESVLSATDEYSFTTRLPLVMRPQAGPTNVVLYLSAQDDLSGVADMMISNRADFGSSVWEPYVTTKDWHVPPGATTTVHVMFRDYAGNVSGVATDSVTTDRPWHAYDLGEPNDTPADAFGPLGLGQTYQAYIWDETDLSDYYHFSPPAGTKIRVDLTHIPAGCDYDLYVYYWDAGLKLYGYSNRDGSSDERVDFSAIPDRKHYIRVYPHRGHNNQQRYRLSVTVR